MKLLIVSWYFPPGNTIGAVRVGKLAKYLHERGVDFRVLCGSDWGLPETLPLEIPPERVVATPWLDVTEPPPPLQWLKRRLVGRKPQPVRAARAGSSGATPAAPGWVSRLGERYRGLVSFPDRQIGWLPFALRSADQLGDWRPDLIYASAPPFTSLFVGQRLARRWGVPWVAEFRDRWVDDPYYPKSSIRLGIETRMERALIRTASGIVTVSEPWAAAYQKKYGLPVATILNGFDPADFPDTDPPASESGPLRIVYTGAIYPAGAIRRPSSMRWPSWDQSPTT